MMKHIKKVFSLKKKDKQKEENKEEESKENNEGLKEEYKRLNIQITEYEREINALIDNKIKLQLALTTLNNDKDKNKLFIEKSEINNDEKCLNCIKQNREILEILDEKKDMVSSILELKKEIKNEIWKSKMKIYDEDPFPSFKKYFIMNGAYYIIDEHNNMYVMTSCEKFQQFKINNSHLTKDQALNSFLNIEGGEQDVKDEKEDKGNNTTK